MNTPPTPPGTIMMAPPTNQPGAMISPLYAARKMKVYAVHEYELNTISTHNAQVTAYLVIASALVSTALSIFLSGLFADHKTMSDAAKLLYVWGSPVSLCMAVPFVILAAIAWWNRRSTVEAIKNESITT